MIKIGKDLQKRRRELKLTYADVSKMTKLSIPHLKAIENGDIEYFKEDLTYLRFYVRSYCKAVDIPYENFKDDVSDSVEEYTNTMTMKIQEEHLKSEQAIREKIKNKKSNKEMSEDNKGLRLAKKDRTSIQQNAQATARFRKAKRLDLAFLSLAVVIALIVLIIVYAGVNSFFGSSNTSEEETPKVSNKAPTPEKEDTKVPEETKKEEKENSKLAFTKDSVSAYSVANIKENDALKIEITFKDRCWFDGQLNGGVIPNAITNTTFEPGQTFTYDGFAKANDVYSFVFGYFPGTIIKVNGETIPLDESLATAAGVQRITLTLKGA